ncbi:lasso RiPP family leader peptide-containing protein [Streptomyces flavochromogenes]|uniref:Lasso RiPP family leader peptide-containing protein n=1 Tax=Streptomyces flavochromogenes TaxID=68199 RepID=A0ABW6XWZ9_9ACTN|nr:lasso RiPP family leader peptide-containing protein [Streptomyces flavochromogenes]
MNSAHQHRDPAHENASAAAADARDPELLLVDAGSVRDVTLGNWSHGHPDDTQHWTPTDD